ncbi:MAG: DMT family transporter [Cyanobacteriota bacterium]|nr:DMT family transporter [Cyanobacteriota bacterium]
MVGVLATDSSTHSTRTLRGIGLVLLATAAFMVMDALIRYFSGSLHPFELAFFRNLFGLLWLLPLLGRVGRGCLQTGQMRFYLLRGLVNNTGMMLFFLGLSWVPLAEATALGFTIPLFASLLAIWILKEATQWQRLLALAAGFLGTLVILRPGFQVISAGSMTILLASLLLAWAAILVKILAQTESSLTITTYMGLVQTPLSLIPALLVWQWPTATEWWGLVALGALGTLGQLAVTQAYRQADLSTLMPFDFSAMIWATLIGYFAFGELPTIWTWIGSAIIFFSGLWIAYDQSQARRMVLSASLPKLPDTHH